MENYPFSSFPESGDSSPQCREPDAETAISWDETPQPAAPRVKIMCSYSGRIQPRPHDNQLSYFGGETKILAVDRSVRFPSLLSRLAALHAATPPAPIRFKYQLPGEDLDALISVTNDEDLGHMMAEYDRLHASGAKPAARLRLFLFPTNPPLKPNPPPAAPPPPPLVPDFLSDAGENQEIQQPAYHGELYAPATAQIPAGYWGDQRGIGGDQPVFLIPASHHGLFPGNAGQGYYAAAGRPPFAYREVPGMYAVAAAQGMEGAGGTQVGFDGMGRAVFYPGPVAAYQAVSNVGVNGEQKMNKNSQIS